MRLLVVDNYDSFTWNLVHYLIAGGAEVEVRRNDALSAGEAAGAADAVVISPGPGTPDDAGISLDLVHACATGRVPLLGVCLGHQAIAQAFGGRVERMAKVMHGKTSAVTHEGEGLFASLPSPFAAARYHSLAVDAASLPPALLVTARSGDGTVMGLRHADLPIHGVQFHPESVASEHGHALIANFLKLAREAIRERP
ncbi:MAG: Anthranilate synthase, amidotransferase component @ Para-aminobenzoate synthase, amidotransferase component [uncultured Sphingomonadaceae bacterium]|uniref:Anthranilate synthase, amidotransferase component @ Para-aminobenzoate synthase, amidotransferase component n=1 Tax=uncultured Sphingomonadaceae bacterium TaxID=169976 RepID=A0A6J4TJK4_9SPHN|nr:MAG: Anthranilate synthase, amidotransferase component @ Para-aminobenzoate synthase, amidotransferase component [uncultured Sphingomonadaceae bacterium]